MEENDVKITNGGTRLEVKTKKSFWFKIRRSQKFLI